jgi:ATP-binding cassette subfamily F protein 3
MRIALARALFCKPDLLLLDEPTNHLDLYAIIWLENYLTSWKGTLLIVSHQRQFLNCVATDILHLFSKKIEHYKGNYDMFEQVRYDRITQQQRRHEAQQKQIKHIQAFIDRFRYNANRAALVQSRVKTLEKMDVVEEVLSDPTLVIQFADPEPLTPPILQFQNASFSYPGSDRVLFRDLDMGVDLESRIALVGANGVGKSTLLNILAGEMEPTKGLVLRHGKLRFARFSQHFVDQLNLELSPLEHFTQTYPGVQPLTARSHLGSFGLSGDLSLRTINTLSGGQKSRLVFAIMAWRKPHVLLLDEPTNHLDMETIDSLVKALLTFRGGVLLISHDERLISLVCDHIWYFRDGKVLQFNGEFSDYKKMLEDELRQQHMI